MQDVARQAIVGQLYDPTDPSAAIVTIDPSNGYIRAMASSTKYQDRTFNLAAQGHRQPGSAFKTMVLTAAIRAGIDPNRTTYVSKPLKIDDPELGIYDWEVQTYSHSYNGTMTIKSATLASDNTVYAQLILDVGPKKVCETAHLLGVTSHLDCYAAEGLGGLTRGVTPLEMANAYATLASGGIRNKPKAIKRVVFPDGKSEDLGKPDAQARAHRRPGLRGHADTRGERARGNGHRRPDRLPDGRQDRHHRRASTTPGSWATRPHLSTAVWVGYPDAQVSMEATRIGSVAGGTWPAMIWHDFMSTAHGDNCDDFPRAHRACRVLPVLRQVREHRLGEDRRVLRPVRDRDHARREVRPALLRGRAARPPETETPPTRDPRDTRSGQWKWKARELRSARDARIPGLGTEMATGMAATAPPHPADPASWPSST